MLWNAHAAPFCLFVLLTITTNFRTLDTFQIPFELGDDLAVLICNSNVRHKLSNSEYPTRRKQCAQALELMRLNSYKDATIKSLDGKYAYDGSTNINTNTNKNNHLLSATFNSYKPKMCSTNPFDSKRKQLQKPHKMSKLNGITVDLTVCVRMM